MSTPLAILPGSSAEVEDIERLGPAPHPREMLSFVGHRGAERLLLEMHTKGRLHHAWLITGPEGIGKATLAFRLARFLLSESERGGGGGMFDAPEPISLYVPSSSPTAHLIANGVHPDLGVLTRRYDPKTKKFRSEISVEDARHVLALLEKTAAYGGWRVVIVDAADDLNTASANALLKTLEEPPAQTIFLLVAHQPQRLLPTIRSRCQVLPLAPLESGEIRQVLDGLKVSSADIETILPHAEGSLRHALRLLDPHVLHHKQAILEALAALPTRRAREVDRIAEACRTGAEGETALADLMEAVETWLHARMRQGAASHAGAGIAAAELWSRLQETRAKVEGFNLDRRAFVITLFEELAALVSPRMR